MQDAVMFTTTYHTNFLSKKKKKKGEELCASP